MNTVTVRGELVRTLREFRDLRSDIGRDLINAYRDQVVAHPDRFDSPTIALVLAGAVRFSATGRAAMLAALREVEARMGEADGAVPFATVSPCIDVTPTGRAVIAACREAGCTEPLARAITLLFIEAHPKLVEVEDEEEGLEASGIGDGGAGEPSYDPHEDADGESDNNDEEDDHGDDR